MAEQLYLIIFKKEKEKALRCYFPLLTDLDHQVQLRVKRGMTVCVISAFDKKKVEINLDEIQKIKELKGETIEQL